MEAAIEPVALAIDFASVHAALAECAVDDKCARVAALSYPAAAPVPPVGIDPAAVFIQPPDARIPGRPGRPELRHPREVPSRGLGSLAGRAALTHAVAHIEFNAINLALDAAWRFRGLPLAYYLDWLSVAQDEARHFSMLQGHLHTLGFAYGDFPAHNGLWEAAEKTAHDLLARMACVPRVLEARGLDVTPGIIRRLREVGDAEFADILEVILAEEVRHVAIGTQWFHRLCTGQGLEPTATFRRLVADYGMGLRPPVNRPARLAAGFAAEELALFDEPPPRRQPA